MSVVSPPGPGPLGVSSIVMRPRHRSATPAPSSAWNSSSTSSRASGSPRPSACARSCRCCSPARSPARTSGWTSTAPTSRSWSRWPFLLAAVLVSARARLRRPRAGARRAAAARLRARRRRRGARRAGGRRLARRPRALDRPRRRRSAPPPPRSASSPRATCSPACAAGSTPRPPARCPSTPRAPRWPAPALSILFPPLALLVVGGLAWLLLGGRRREGEKYAGLRILR